MRWLSPNDGDRVVLNQMFGELKLNRESSQRFWRGNVIFAPTQSPVALFLFDLDSGLTKAHIDFYLELEAKYDGLKAEIAMALAKEYTSSVNTLDQDAVWKTFSIVGISIPFETSIRTGSFEWDLYFSYDAQRPDFLIEMSQWSVEACYAGE